MVEVECPSCTKTVDLGSDSTGTYECPYCHEDFEYESSIKNNLKNNQSQFGYMMYGVKKVTKPFAGYYRLGVLRDYNEEEKEENERRLAELTNSIGHKLTLVFLAIVLILGSPLILPALFYRFCQLKFQRLIYKRGGHPGKRLTEVDHLYIHPDGRVIVPLNDLAPFRFNIEGEMRIETHYREGWWSSVSILKGRKCYFSLGGTDVAHFLASSSTWSGTGLEEIYQFLGRFDLKESERFLARRHSDV